MDFQATDNWRVTGRYMNNKEDILQAYGTTWAGNGSDQLPTPTLFVHPGSNYMLSATGILNTTTSLELSWGRASNSLNYELQQRAAVPRERRRVGAAAAVPGRGPGRLHPLVRLPRRPAPGNAGQYQTDRGPFTNENITHDVHRQPDEGLGRPLLEGRRSTTSTASSRRASSRASTARSTSRTTRATRSTRASATRTPPPASSTSTSRPRSTRCPNGATRTSSGTRRTTGSPTDRLTLDYGVRFYYVTPQWDTTLQASNFLPDQFDSGATPRSSIRPVCVGGAPGAGCVRRGMDPTLIAQGVAPTLANTVEERFIGRLTPGSNRFNGAFQAGQGINDQLQDGNAFRVSPRFGVVYDLSGKRRTILRGGFGIFYDRPQGNTVFDMIANAPGVLELEGATGGGCRI